LLLVEDKAALMRKLGKRRLTVVLTEPMADLPASLSDWALTLEEDGHKVVYTFDAETEAGIPALLRKLDQLKIDYRDLDTARSSLEDIFVTLVEGAA